MEEERLILWGDFNAVMDIEKDRSHHYSIQSGLPKQFHIWLEVFCWTFGDIRMRWMVILFTLVSPGLIMFMLLILSLSQSKLLPLVFVFLWITLLLYSNGYVDKITISSEIKILQINYNWKLIHFWMPIRKLQIASYFGKCSWLILEEYESKGLYWQAKASNSLGYSFQITPIWKVAQRSNSEENRCLWNLELYKFMQLDTQ